MNRLGISGYTALSGNKLLLKSRYEQRNREIFLNIPQQRATLSDFDTQRSLESTIAPVGPADAEPTEVHARCVRALYVTLCVTTLLRIHLVDPWIAEESSSRWPCLHEAPGEIFVYGHMVVQVSNLKTGFNRLIMLQCHHTRITRSLAGLETAAYVTTTPPTCTAPTTSTSAVVGSCARCGRAESSTSATEGQCATWKICFAQFYAPFLLRSL